MEFTGKNVLITGGNSGIGEDMALAFANRGAVVTITGRRADRLQQVADKHANIHATTADVTDPVSTAEIFKEKAYQIVIANAGIAASSPFSKTSYEDWSQMININLTGTFLTLSQGMAQMENGGRLIAISSILGVTGAAYASSYAASKHGIVGMVKSASREVGKTGITVNAVCPGYLDTEMTQRTVANIMSKTDMSQENAVKSLVGGKPDGQLIPMSDVTDTTLWVASDGAASVNGQAIVISGGQYYS